MPEGTVVRTEHHQFVNNERLMSLCRQAKNLYNRANYLVRQHYDSTGKYMNYYAVYSAIKDEECYTVLASQAAQCVLRRLDKNWQSFFALRKTDKTARIPKYKRKDGYFVWEYAGSKLSVRNGCLKIPKTSVKIKVASEHERVLWFRLVPKNDMIVAEIVIEKKYGNEYEKVRKKGKVVGIDVGVNNLAALVSNEDGERPCLVNGRPLKSINQYYNKKMSKLRSVCEKVSKKKTSKRIKKLASKRSNKVSDYLHKASRAIVNACVGMGAGTVVVGRNVGWKDGCSLGKRNNQNFTYLPTTRLVEMLRYKFQEYGIAVVETEESYTSKCDHLSYEPMTHIEKRSGRRTSRGTFESGTGITLNADVNGAYGMLRKINAVDERFFESIVDRGHVVWPVKLSVPY